MERFIAERNIAHYQGLLAGDLAPNERRTLTKLLAEEEAKLAEIPPRHSLPKADPRSTLSFAQSTKLVPKRRSQAAELPAYYRRQGSEVPC